MVQKCRNNPLHFLLPLDTTRTRSFIPGVMLACFPSYRRYTSQLMCTVETASNRLHITITFKISPPFKSILWRLTSHSFPSSRQKRARAVKNVEYLPRPFRCRTMCKAKQKKQKENEEACFVITFSITGVAVSSHVRQK